MSINRLIGMIGLLFWGTWFGLLFWSWVRVPSILSSFSCLSMAFEFCHCDLDFVCFLFNNVLSVFVILLMLFDGCAIGSSPRHCRWKAENDRIKISWLYVLRASFGVLCTHITYTFHFRHMKWHTIDSCDSCLAYKSAISLCSKME